MKKRLICFVTVLFFALFMFNVSDREAEASDYPAVPGVKVSQNNPFMSKFSVDFINEKSIFGIAEYQLKARSLDGDYLDASYSTQDQYFNSWNLNLSRKGHGTIEITIELYVYNSGSKKFVLTKQTILEYDWEVHGLTYEVDNENNRICTRCTVDDCTEHYDDGYVEFNISDKEFDGEKFQADLNLSSSWYENELIDKATLINDLTYKGTGDTIYSSNVAPSEIGTYECVLTIEGFSISAPFNIHATEITNFTAPTAIEGLEYDFGKSMSLIETGAAGIHYLYGSAISRGTMKYSLDGENWLTDAPKASSVGTHRVYWKIEGNRSNPYIKFADNEGGYIDVEILPKTLSNNFDFTFDNFAIQYNGEEITLNIIAASYDSNDITDVFQYDIVDNVHTEAGTYDVIITGKGNFAGQYVYQWTIQQLTPVINESFTFYTGTDKPKYGCFELPSKAPTTAENVEADIVNEAKWFNPATSLWEDITISKVKNAGLYKITYHVEETSNIMAAEWTYDLIVEKYRFINDDDFLEKFRPIASSIVFGQKLSESVLSPEGAWEWLRPNAVLNTNDTYAECSHIMDPNNYDYTNVTGAATKVVARYAEIEVLKADLTESDIITAPTAIEGLKFNLEEQVLVNPGVLAKYYNVRVNKDTGKGTIVYKVDAEETYSSELPTAKDVGVYTVYWMVQGDESYNDHEGGSFEVTISAKKVAIPTASTEEYHYTGSTIRYEFANDSESKFYNVSENRESVNVGTYTITVSLIDDVNSCWEDSTTSPLTYTFEIKKQLAALVDAPTGLTLVYDGTNQNLVVPGSAINGTIVYCLEEDGDYSETIPTAKKVGTYTVYWYILADEGYADNHNDCVAINVTMNKKQISVPTPDNTVFYYNGEELTYNLGNKVDEDFYSISGDLKNTNVGTTNITISLNEPSCCEWEGLEGAEAIEDIVYSFVILPGLAEGEAPVANILLFTATEQALVTAGTTKNGTMMYKLETENDYSNTIPTGVEAGEYRVYWYVKANEGYSDYHLDSEEYITVVINYDLSEAVITLDNDSFVYDTNEKIPTITSIKIKGVELNNTNYETDLTAKTNAGTYEITFTSKLFSEGTTEVTWTIEKATVNIDLDTTKIVKTYNETFALPTATSSNGDNVVVSRTINDLKNVGTYTVKYEVLETANYKYAYKELEVEIKPIVVTSVNATSSNVNTYGAKLSDYVLSEGWTWANANIVPTVNNNGYEAKFVVNDYTNYDYSQVEGYSSDTHIITKVVDVTVNKLVVAKPALDSTNFVYNGENQTYTLPANVNYTISNNVKKDAGVYTVTVELVDKDNTIWNDNTSSNITYEFKISKKNIENASVIIENKKLQETGEEFTVAVIEVKVDGMTVTYQVSGNVASVNGTHVLTITGTGNFEGVVTRNYIILPKVDEELDTQVDDDGNEKVVIGDGKISFDVIVDEEAPTASIETDKVDLINNALSSEDIDKVANGDDIDIWIEITDSNDKVDADMKDNFEEAAKKIDSHYTVAVYFNLDMYKKLYSEEHKTSITELNEKIRLSVEIPEEVFAKGRSYFIARNHEGVIEIIEAEYDENTNQLFFETDRFSTWAIGYKEHCVICGNRVPMMGNLCVVFWIIVLASCCALGFGGFYVYKKVKKESNEDDKESDKACLNDK